MSTIKRVVILQSQEGDWEGLYVDGKCISQSHTLGEGDGKLFLLRKAKEFSFTIDDVIVKYVNNDDEEMLQDGGMFPENLDELKGTYNDI